MKNKIKIYLLLFIFFGFIKLNAQLTHTFTKTAQNIHYGHATDVAVGIDGTVFLANHDGGLLAFELNDTLYINTARIEDSDYFWEVVAGHGGTVFVKTEGELRAYFYDGSSIVNTANIQIDTYGGGTDLAVQNENTIFLVSYLGLHAYYYNGSSFKSKAFLEGKHLGSITLGSDSTIFLTNGVYGFKSYIYTDSSFIAIDSTSENIWDIAVDDNGNVFVIKENGMFLYGDDTIHFEFETNEYESMVIGNNNTIFLKSDSLYAIRYIDNSLSVISSINLPYKNDEVSLAAVDNKVFLAGYHGGLYAYNLENNKFSDPEYIFQGGVAIKAESGLDNTIFLANGDGGLRVYTIEDSSFLAIAHVTVDSLGATDIKVDNNNTVFIIVVNQAGGGVGDLPCDQCDHRDVGIYAYRFNGTTLVQTAHIDDEGTAYRLAIGPDSTIFLANGYGGIRAYRYDGKFNHAGHIEIDGRVTNVEVSDDGVLFVSTDLAGLYAFTYNDTSFFQNAYSDIGEWIDNIITGPDGTVFLATGGNLVAFSYDDTSFTSIANIQDNSDCDCYLEIQDAAIRKDGIIIILDNEVNGLRAFSFDGLTFKNIAYVNNIVHHAGSVSIGPQGVVLVTGDKLFAYSFSPITGFKKQLLQFPKHFKLEQNYPNPFNPSTVISYQLAVYSEVVLTVYDVTGREIKTLVNKKQSAGRHSVIFDATGLASGIYFYILKTGSFEKSRKMLLLR